MMIKTAGRIAYRGGSAVSSKGRRFIPAGTVGEVVKTHGRDLSEVRFPEPFGVQLVAAWQVEPFDAAPLL